MDIEKTIAYFQARPRKLCSAGALFFNEQGQLLIVKPTYRDDWLVPGGAVEADESPRLGCAREVQEEIGLTVPITRLLCVDYANNYGPTRPESLFFVFYGKVLTGEEIAQIVLPLDELSEYRFVDTQDAPALVAPRLGQRLPHCLQALEQGGTVYLEDNEPVA